MAGAAASDRWSLIAYLLLVALRLPLLLSNPLSKALTSYPLTLSQ